MRSDQPITKREVHFGFLFAIDRKYLHFKPERHNTCSPKTNIVLNSNPEIRHSLHDKASSKPLRNSAIFDSCNTLETSLESHSTPMLTGQTFGSIGRVCVFIGDGYDKVDSSAKSDSFVSSSHPRKAQDKFSSVNYSMVAEELASNFSLPLFSSDGRLCGTNNANNSQNNDSGAQLQTQYTHCLRIVPFRYKNLHTYAVAIQQMEKVGDTSRSQKRNKKRHKRWRPSDSGTQPPFYVNLCPPLKSKLGRRLGGGNDSRQHSEMLLKAIAPMRSGVFGKDGENSGAVVYDLTAGFGQDSTIIALGGASSVHMVERDPVVGLLLNDAIRRLKLVATSCDPNDEVVQRALELSSKLSLHQDDGVRVAKKITSHEKFLGSQHPTEKPDVCYLDPMFPPRQKSAAVKKNMQILHGLLQTNQKANLSKNSKSIEDAERCRAEQNLLEAAMEAARVRVVVKRPINAAALGGVNSERKPSHDIRGSVNRWDVYVKS